MMTLKEVPIGSTVTIKKVCATGPLKRRPTTMRTLQKRCSLPSLVP